MPNNPSQGQYEWILDLIPKVVGAIAALYVIWRKGLKPMVEVVQKARRLISDSEKLLSAMRNLESQLKTNGGTSLRDVVDRIERSADLATVRMTSLINFANNGVYESDPDGSCRFANRRLCELTGLHPEQHLGNGWVVALHPEDRDRVFTEWRSSVSAAREFVMEYRFIHADGKTVKVECRSVPMRNPGGKLIGHMGTLKEIK